MNVIIFMFHQAIIQFSSVQFSLIIQFGSVQFNHIHPGEFCKNSSE